VAELAGQVLLISLIMPHHLSGLKTKFLAQKSPVKNWAKTKGRY
jgi:hypothetical protein